MAAAGGMPNKPTANTNTNRMAHGITWSLSLMLLAESQGVLGYYCDSDQCTGAEYCCGANICCGTSAVWQVWYFWCGIALLVLLLMACAGLCRYRYHTSRVIILRDKPLYARLGDPGYTYTDAKEIPYNEAHYTETSQSLPTQQQHPSPPPYSQEHPYPQGYPQGTEKDPTHKR